MIRPPPSSTLFPYTTLFRSATRSPWPTSSALPSTARPRRPTTGTAGPRSEEHTSELQSLTNLVCRLLLEKKKSSPVAVYVACALPPSGLLQVLELFRETAPK